MSVVADVTVVTGGSRGIGRAVVEALVNLGKHVAFTWRSDERMARDVEQASAGMARGYQCDLRDRPRTAALVEEVEGTFGPILGLVNNAGIQTSSLLAMTTDRVWDEILDVNLGGAFRLTREVLRHMVSRRRGAIVNVSSLSALHGVPGHSAYAASKAGLVAMTRCVAREMGRRNIRVNAVIPGYVATDMTSDLPDHAVHALRSGEVLSGGTDLASVAAVVLFLLSDDAQSITGQSIIVDAGTTAGDMPLRLVCKCASCGGR